jgi:hypothetical protein
MAKAGAIGNGNKTTFGVRKKGQPQKAYNKHTPKPKKYRGQGR